MRQRIGILFGLTLACWALAAYPAYLLWGASALVYSSAAFGLCLLPAALTMLWAGWAFNQTPDQQLTMVLGGTGVRMFLVLGAGMILYFAVPYFRQPGFWLWLLVAYLLTLTIEVVLIVKTLTPSDIKGPRTE